MKKTTKSEQGIPAKETATDFQDSIKLNQVDLVTASLLSTSALVSGWLSYQGASAIFGDGMTALGFTIVVQGVVSLSLWRFAVERGLQRILLASAWAVAVTFSIGTAYVNVDQQNNTASAIASADTEIASYEAAIQSQIQAAFTAAADKRQEAAIEAQNGGCGKICNGLKQEAETLQAQAEHLESTIGSAITASANARATPDQSLPELLKVYQQLKTGAGELAAGVPEPEFIQNTAPSSFDRIANAYNRLFSKDKAMDVATIGAFWVTCLMELLALTCATIRLSSRMKPSKVPMETRLEKSLAWFYDLRTLPKRIALLATRRSEEWMKAFKPRSSVSRSKTGKQVAGAIKTDQEYWTEGLHLQAQTSEVPMVELITMLVQDQATVTAQSGIDEKTFAKTAGITNVLMNTGVLSKAKSGLMAGEKWNEWNIFLLEEYRRQRLQKPASTTTRLRQVA